MIKKVLCVIVAVVALVCGLVIPTSAAVVSGSNTSAYMNFIPYNIYYAFQFGEVDTYYQFSVFDSVIQGSFAASRTGNSTFGSEDYRTAGIGTFVIYPAWTEWGYNVNNALRYVDSVNYNTILPECRFTDCVLLDDGGMVPDEFGATFHFNLSFDLLHLDGSVSQLIIDDLEDIEWNNNGLFSFTYNSTDYANFDGGSVDSRLAAIHDDNPIYCIKSIRGSGGFSGDVNQSNSTSVYYVYADTEYASTTGYTLVRTIYNGAYNFDEPIVEWLTPSSLLDWLGQALNGVMNVTLFEFAGLPFTPAGLLYMCFGLLGLFAILRFFAGG